MLDDDDDELTGESGLDSTPRLKTRALPLAMLTRSLGPSLSRFKDEPALCAFVQVKSDAWVQPLVAAARTIARWDSVVETDGNARNHDRVVGDVADRLAMGQRILIVATQANPVGKRLLPHCDLVIPIVAIGVPDVSMAIQAVTGARPRGLRPADVVGLDLASARASIRSGSTPASCVRRIRSARTSAEIDPQVQSAVPLEELHGYGEARTWGERLISDLNRWRDGGLEFQAIERNMVLAGPPGVGKSTFVRSLARSSGLPLIASSMGTLFATTSGYLDSVIKGIDSLFSSARAAGPAALLFIDELEGFPSRDDLEGRHASWWTPVINHLLTSLDSSLSPASSNLIVIGATNHPGRLDPALTRKGRLDRVIWIDPPDEKSLEGIFRQHLGRDLRDHAIDDLVTAASGATGADVAGFVKGAHARARAEERPVRKQDVLAEICPPSTMSDADIWRACVHECGHAIVTLALKAGSIKSIAITSAQGSGGRIAYQKDSSLLVEEQSIRMLVIRLLAGRAAEEVLLKCVSTGSGGAIESDLAKASSLLAAAHMSWALRGSLLHLATPEQALAEARQIPEVRAAIGQELNELYQQALFLVEKNATDILSLAGRLKEERVLAGARLQQILSELNEVGEGQDHA